MIPAIRVFLPLLLLFMSLPASAGERILRFDSDVLIDPSGLLHVTETITVVAEGKEIKRGIYRDFPTRYSNRFGATVSVDFKVVEVLRGGQPEPYHLKKQDNGIRVYIGNADVLLDPGEYRYTLRYITDRQIGFFQDYDELYWNVTGTGWSFPIESATAAISLPQGAAVKQWALYTGPEGSKETHGILTGEEGNVVSFATTRPLPAGHGLTVAVAFPKGLVQEPDEREMMMRYGRDNLGLLVGGVALLLLLAYFSVVWFFVGRDPAPGTIIPRFKPPRGLSPAAARFIVRMGFDERVFAAALVSLAVKGHVRIKENNGVFVVQRGDGNQEKLSSGEQAVVGKLLGQQDSITLKQKNHSRIGKAVKGLKKSLHNEFEAVHFRRNRRYMIPALLTTILVMISLVVTARQKDLAAFIAVWLSGWSVGCYLLLVRMISAWKEVSRPLNSTLTKAGNIVGAVFSTLFALPFFGGWFFGAGLLVHSVSLLPALTLLLILCVNLVFYSLLKAPTVLGREMLDKLEGLKLYLAVAEKDRLNMLNPPEKTPELFERFLPWALALEVEQEWAEQFSDVLAKASEDGSGYRPGWYSSSRPLTSSGLAAGLGSSLASSIASSSTAPGSSSGSGGGGSSGGGGGGGGGGGW